MGAMATVSNTFAFGSHKVARDAHKKTWFAQLPHDRIKVLNEARDIGGHLDSTGRHTKTTGS